MPRQPQDTSTLLSHALTLLLTCSDSLYLGGGATWFDFEPRVFGWTPTLLTCSQMHGGRTSCCRSTWYQSQFRVVFGFGRVSCTPEPYGCSCGMILYDCSSIYGCSYAHSAILRESYSVGARLCVDG
ncbi:hypothetical protein B0I75DRAFT_17759 [Yarrowia lipolytica]|uniref:Secreted protein n=1 Tax=Yarrowia lipolytica TaxID=4952 RepID=A0A371CCV8_YARLL|nr:hypothetical protein BKA91DRAFT_15242 [Yarrowia lipolytica]KAE8174095.1 hypothetical protein BKA90DRAFT_45683 [Yarrowia lipolytica]RDW28103.1 hypothetical protein B0I71DRAFT_7655 [Yarrowia lipolytica]RDW44797.1 hypothetical protein B0I74DRAFT_42904 [Yarrowia lipolytica]RDW49638.1 hypothetical protein B0I75DRAFT_17759 [Yarrowia lipolytica]